MNEMENKEQKQKQETMPVNDGTPVPDTTTGDTESAVPAEVREENPVNEAVDNETAVNEVTDNEADNTGADGNEQRNTVDGDGNRSDGGELLPEAEADAADAPEKPVYLWSFSEQAAHDRAEAVKAARRGARTYGIIMTACFAVCFVMLIAAIIIGFSGGLSGNGNTVYVDRTIYVRQDTGDSGLLTIPEIASKVSPSVVGIYVTLNGGTGVGSGIVMSADGYIATNYHVIEKAKTVTVITSDGTEYNATVIGGDELSDIALLQVPATGLTAAEFGDSDQLLVGEDVVAIGTPAGLEYAGTVTDGIISAINRDVKIYDDYGLLVKTMTLIQTNTSINPGNSGGPLIDAYGKVIGINSMKLADDYDGIGFAIPINGALRILSEIKETGSYSGSGDVAEQGARLGIAGTGVEAGSEYRLSQTVTVKADVTGVLVTAEATEEYDAYGKLKLYDIITEIDGTAVTSINDIRSCVFRHKVGDSLPLKVYRDGSYITVDVKLGG